ncbi:flagellar filament capping protein FliD [Paraferrimonas sp. SM1919]|uniref:flagellar filament capping protein FliD n=1 Tax=Paraferrimonas sp. SM1919 TaxID=2662263 RepID=UPI0013D8DBB2|nr:flagellar filament capping protein FliD [Paraferrimonas sp. SM1919]
MGLTAAGIGSGLDINGIVESLVNVEKAPKVALFDKQQGELTTEISAIGALKAAMESFQEKLQALQDEVTYNSSKVTQSNKDYLTATVAEGVAASSYSIEVNQLATAHKLASVPLTSAESIPGAGFLKISSGEETFQVDLTWSDSLQDAADLINNSEQNSTVTAAVISSDDGARLVLTSKETGTANNITVIPRGSDNLKAAFDAINMTDIAAQDAQLLIDGFAVTSSSNTVENAINGVTLDLKQAALGEATKVTISADNGKTTTAVKEFVDSYNELISTMSSMSGYDSETGDAGVLQGDSLIRTFQSQVRNSLFKSFSDGGEDKILSHYGISLDEFGKMSLDTAKLNDTLETSPNKVQHFFAAEDSGFAAHLHSVVDVYTQTGGLLDSRDQTLDIQMERIEDSRVALDRKMVSYEARLYAQYSAMDLLVAQLNTQGSFLASRFDSLPGMVKSN